MIGAWAERPWGTPWRGDPAINATADGITAIGLRRGMCYGPCPVYTVTLRRSGDARFEGEHFVDLMGKHRARIDRAAFADLARAIAYVGFESLDPKYAVEWTGAATTTTWIVRNGERHEVEDYGGAGPDRLHRLVELVDEAASGLDWRPVGRSRPTGDGPLFAGLTADETWRPPSAGEEPAHWTQRSRGQR